MTFHSRLHNLMGPRRAVYFSLPEWIRFTIFVRPVLLNRVAGAIDDTVGAMFNVDLAVERNHERKSRTSNAESPA
jgi:hypothetical protein